MGSDLNQTRYDQLIRRVGAIIGPGSKVSEALTELFPVIDVERVPGELLLLGGTQLCLGAAVTTGDALERPRIQLFNPVGSGKLITVSSMQLSSQNTGITRYAIDNVALTDGLGTELFRDSRLGRVARPVGQIRSDSLVAIIDANAIMRLLASTTKTIEDPNSIAVLSPGFGLSVGHETIQATIQVTFNWRERIAEQSELLFP